MKYLSPLLNARCLLCSACMTDDLQPPLAFAQSPPDFYLGAHAARRQAAMQRGGWMQWFKQPALCLVQCFTLLPLLQKEVTYYIPKSHWSSVAAHHQPHFCGSSAFWISEGVCISCNITKAGSQVGFVGDTAINIAGK